MIDRYGDIWGGFILKSLIDLKDEAIAVGEPMIHHTKEGNHIRNIWQENLGHQINDEFIDLLADALANVRPASYLSMMEALTAEFHRLLPACSPLLRAYLVHLTGALDAWNAALAGPGG